MQARDAAATLAQLPDGVADREWLGRLESWRQTLVDERFAIKSPIKDKHLLGLARNLECSLRYIDRGEVRQMHDLGYAPDTLRLGALMRDAGCERWLGSTEEVQHRIRETERRRAQAQAALAGALMDDDAREKREAESKALRDAFNAMDVKIGPDGTLVAYKADGDVLDAVEMTPLQRKAFERMDALHRR